jgi:hypothetical protein
MVLGWVGALARLAGFIGVRRDQECRQLPQY